MDEEQCFSCYRPTPSIPVSPQPVETRCVSSPSSFNPEWINALHGKDGAREFQSDSLMANRTCEKCLSRSDVFLDGLVVVGHYHRNKELAKAVHAVKYGKRTEELVEKLGKLLQKALEKHFQLSIPPPQVDFAPLNNYQSSPNLQFSGPDRLVLVPIPLYVKRLEERGFNQAELLAKAVLQQGRGSGQVVVSSPNPPKGEQQGCFASYFSLIVDTSLLERYSATKSQVEVGNRAGRLKNLEGAFRVLKKPDSSVIYFLVDDVCTTGATLSVCAKVLKEAGASEVWGLAVMRA